MEKHVSKALILTADYFEDTEVSFPIEDMHKQGWEVTVAAPSLEIITGKHGHQISPDVEFSKVNPAIYDVLILPGGQAPNKVRQDADSLRIVRAFFAADKIVAAICHGAQILVSADVVRGRHLTSYTRDNVPEEIKSAGGTWEDKEVIVDGNLITSRNKPDLPAFMLETIKAVDKRIGRGYNHAV